MKLLFQKEGADPSEELNSLLGFIDADFDFDSLKPDIKTATRELVRLIGQPMYDKIFDWYENAPEENEELIDSARFPIAVRAYYLFAANNDLAHTNVGRKIRKDNNQVSAFEWQIEKDNEALERRYYRALDDLLTELEPNEAWKASEAYKALNKLFIRTTNEFDEYFTIESRFILQKLSPGIRQCEQDQIKPRIGAARYQALKTALAGTQPLSDADRELLALIREACVYYSLSWAMVRLSVNIFPEGVLQAYTSDRDTVKVKQPAKKLETQAARQAFREDAEDIFLKIEKLMAPVPQPTAQDDTPLLPETYTGKNFLSL